MYRESEDEDEDDEHEFDEDMEALRRACLLTGTNPADLNNHHQSSDTAATTTGSSTFDTDSDDDLELVRNIQKRFSINTDLCQPLSMAPLFVLPPVDAEDDSDDDFETLRAIQRRFSAYDSNTLKNCTEDLMKPNQSCASSIASEKDIASDLFVNATSTCERFQNYEDSWNSIPPRANVENQPSHLIEGHQSVVCKESILPLKVSTFPKSAQLLVDAIKKNRSCQKFLRSKFTQVEARIEENKQLKERVKILKDFQAACRRKTGRALSQKKDPRVQLISVQKLRSFKDSKANDKKVSAMYYSPAENSRVANYRMALTQFPLSVDRKIWSKTEMENLGKGIRQQFQEMMVQISTHDCNTSDGASEDPYSYDDILASIKSIELTPERIREFLPKVNWEQLAFMYFVGRSGSECEARWLNHEDPLINRSPWTNKEDKKMKHIVEDMGISNWFDIAVSLGTSRTPFQCLVRYQRSLYSSALKSEWTEDEDVQLCAYVEAFGESNWQAVASMLQGRTGSQCSNRWRKTLHPDRKSQGRWNSDEDKRLTVATMIFGPQNWKKIAQHVAGRNEVQCRERWVNSLDPNLYFGEWTEEEDSTLKAAILEHGHCWSKVAECVPRRTDNQCLRRWKLLFPDKVPLLQAARKIKKAALISNFVDREAERPALGPNDFVPLPVICSETEAANVNSSRKPKRTRGKEARVSSEEILGMTKCNAVQKKKRVNKRGSSMNQCIKPVQDPLSSMIINGKEDGVSRGPTNDEDIEACGITTTSNKRKRVSKRRTTNDTELMHDQPSCLEPTNVEGIDASARCINRKKRVPKLHSKKKTCTAPDEDGINMLPPEHPELRIADTAGVENVCVDQNNNTSLKKYRRRNKGQDVASVPCHNNSIQKSEITEGDDATLDCFRWNKSKKRRLERSKNADRVSEENRKLPHMLKGESQTCFNDEIAENSSSFNTPSSCSKDMPAITDITDCEPVKESVNANSRDDNDESEDATLSCLLKKLKKKRPRIHKSSG